MDKDTVRDNIIGGTFIKLKDYFEKKAGKWFNDYLPIYNESGEETNGYCYI